MKCEPDGFVRLPEAVSRDWESGLGSWADSSGPIESPGFATPPHDGCAFHLAVRLNDNDCIGRNHGGLNGVRDRCLSRAAICPKGLSANSSAEGTKPWV